MDVWRNGKLGDGGKADKGGKGGTGSPQQALADEHTSDLRNIP